MRFYPLVPKPNPNRTRTSQHKRTPSAARALQLAPTLASSWTPSIAAKLRVGDADDALEQQADAIAERVMNMPDPRVAPAAVSEPSAAVGGDVAVEPLADELDEQLIDAPPKWSFAGSGDDGVRPTHVPLLERIRAIRAANDLQRACSSCAAEDELQRACSSCSTDDELQRACATCETEDELRRACASCAAEDELQRACASCAVEDELQRACASCAAEDELQRAWASRAGALGREGAAGRAGGPASTAYATRLAAAERNGGRPLDRAVRSFFQPRFGRDLDAVRIHSDFEAVRLATAIGARAFTHGQHVFFAAGEYRPDDRAGRTLLAHELVHTLQNAASPSLALRRVPLPEAKCPMDRSAVKALFHSNTIPTLEEIRRSTYLKRQKSLKYGDKGEGVAALQAFLLLDGCGHDLADLLLKEYGSKSHRFGSTTKVALRDYQTANDDAAGNPLDTTGILDTRTLSAIDVDLGLKPIPPDIVVDDREDDACVLSHPGKQGAGQLTEYEKEPDENNSNVRLDHWTLWNYDIDSALLKKGHTDALSRIAKAIDDTIEGISKNHDGGVELIVEGKASTTGSMEHNKKLGEQRAKCAFTYLSDRLSPATHAFLASNFDVTAVFSEGEATAQAENDSIVEGGGELTVHDLENAHHRAVEIKLSWIKSDPIEPEPEPEPDEQDDEAERCEDRKAAEVDLYFSCTDTPGIVHLLAVINPDDPEQVAHRYFEIDDGLNCGFRIIAPDYHKTTAFAVSGRIGLRSRYGLDDELFPSQFTHHYFPTSASEGGPDAGEVEHRYSSPMFKEKIWVPGYWRAECDSDSEREHSVTVRPISDIRCYQPTDLSGPGDCSPCSREDKQARISKLHAKTGCAGGDNFLSLASQDPGRPLFRQYRVLIMDTRLGARSRLNLEPHEGDVELRTTEGVTAGVALSDLGAGDRGEIVASTKTNPRWHEGNKSYDGITFANQQYLNIEKIPIHGRISPPAKGVFPDFTVVLIPLGEVSCTPLPDLQPGDCKTKEDECELQAPNTRVEHLVVRSGCDDGTNFVHLKAPREDGTPFWQIFEVELDESGAEDGCAVFFKKTLFERDVEIRDGGVALSDINESAEATLEDPGVLRRSWNIKFAEDSGVNIEAIPVPVESSCYDDIGITDSVEIGAKLIPRSEVTCSDDMPAPPSNCEVEEPPPSEECSEDQLLRASTSFRAKVWRAAADAKWLKLLLLIPELRPLASRVGRALEGIDAGSVLLSLVTIQTMDTDENGEELPREQQISRTFAFVGKGSNIQLYCPLHYAESQVVETEDPKQLQSGLAGSWLGPSDFEAQRASWRVTPGYYSDRLYLDVDGEPVEFNFGSSSQARCGPVDFQGLFISQGAAECGGFRSRTRLPKEQCDSTSKLDSHTEFTIKAAPADPRTAVPFGLGGSIDGACDRIVAMRVNIGTNSDEPHRKVYREFLFLGANLSDCPYEGRATSFNFTVEDGAALAYMRIFNPNSDFTNAAMMTENRMIIGDAGDLEHLENISKDMWLLVQGLQILDRIKSIKDSVSSIKTLILDHDFGDFQGCSGGVQAVLGGLLPMWAVQCGDVPAPIPDAITRYSDLCDERGRSLPLRVHKLMAKIGEYDNFYSSMSPGDIVLPQWGDADTPGSIADKVADRWFAPGQTVLEEVRAIALGPKGERLVGLFDFRVREKHFDDPDLVYLGVTMLTHACWYTLDGKIAARVEGQCLDHYYEADTQHFFTKNTFYRRRTRPILATGGPASNDDEDENPRLA